MASANVTVLSLLTSPNMVKRRRYISPMARLSSDSLLCLCNRRTIP